MQGKLTTLSRRALLAAPLAVAAGCRAQESVAASASAAPGRAEHRQRPVQRPRERAASEP